MNRLVINADLGNQRISRHIYGHFAEHLGRCIYGGLWVGEDSLIPNLRGLRQDVVDALRAIRVPNLRWPGGCFADEYHWMDGIGARAQRPAMLNTHWGGVVETNHFGTHEYMDLCAQLDCEPYICANLGSGTVREMQQWVEYLTAPAGPMADLRRQHGRAEPWTVRMWGVGNENWGCGGSMRPEYYADEYRRYATYCRNLGDNVLYRIACGPSGADYRWTRVLMREAAGRMQALAPHYYCGSGSSSRSATDFAEEDWFYQLQRALLMDELIRRHGAIMDQYDPDRRVGMVIDEWGTWHAVEPGTHPGFLYQQNSLRDALVAGATLNIFNQHCDRVQGANIAQTVNVLQAMVLTEEDSDRILLTPTYHAFEMFKEHQDAMLVETTLDSEDYAFGDACIPAINASASRNDAAQLLLTVCNMDPNGERQLRCEVRGMTVNRLTGRVLTAAEMTAHNTFDDPHSVRPEAYIVPEIHHGTVKLMLPPRSVLAIKAE